MDATLGEDFRNDGNRPVCFEVIPYYVEVQQIPPCAIGGGFGVGENWHKQKSKTFVVCSGCWRKLGLAVALLPVSPERSDGLPQQGDVRPDSIVPLPKASTATLEDLEPLD